MRALPVWLFIFVLLAGCKSDETSPIVGKWKVMYVDFEGGDIDEEVRKETKRVAESVKYNFKEDFTYTIYSNLDMEGEGKWKYHKGEQALKLTNKSSDMMSFKVFFPDENRLDLHINISNTNIIYHLNRINP